ncbi:MAG: hypothetical protein D6711_10215, partial [Chloroflexi bacterium]
NDLVQYELVGRRKDWEDLEQKLADDARPLFILGYGGLGKTRMAAELARASERFPDGAVWHFVSDISSPLGLLEQMARHLELEPNTPTDQIIHKFCAKQALIVLDNAESVKDAQAYRDFLGKLDSSNGVRVVLTSRQRWPIYKNTQVQKHELSAMGAEEALILLERMLDVARPDFMPTPEQRRLLAQACRHHPRLMEFAVDLLDVKPVDSVIEELQSLKGHTAEEALEEMVFRSLEQMRAQELGEKARKALDVLVVCRGGFTEDAAKALLSDHPLATIILGDTNQNPLLQLLQLMKELMQAQGVPMDGDTDGLIPLKRWNFLRVEGERYTIPLLIRDAIEHLGSTPPDAHQRHFQYYYHWAKEVDADQKDAGRFARMDAEAENLA